MAFLFNECQVVLVHMPYVLVRCVCILPIHHDVTKSIYLTKKMWTPAHRTSDYKNIDKELVRSDTDVGRLDLDGSQRFNSSQKVFDGVELRTLCGPVKFFYTDLDK